MRVSDNSRFLGAGISKKSKKHNYQVYSEHKSIIESHVIVILTDSLLGH